MPNPLSIVELTPDEILVGLDQALLAERQAVADYGAHARASERQDIRESLETLRDVESEHAQRLARRIAALGGTASDTVPEARSPGDSLADWLASDLRSEQWAIVEYARLVAGVVEDAETAELMAELLADEISHAGWLKSAVLDLRWR